MKKLSKITESIWSDMQDRSSGEIVRKEDENFNCDLSKWDVSNVENMLDMFRDCIKFNCDLSKWNVSK